MVQCLHGRDSSAAAGRRKALDLTADSGLARLGTAAAEETLIPLQLESNLFLDVRQAQPNMNRQEREERKGSNFAVVCGTSGEDVP